MMRVAQQYTTPKSLNLDVITIKPLTTPAIAHIVAPRKADITQLGTARLAKPAQCGLQAVDGFTIDFPYMPDYGLFKADRIAGTHEVKPSDIPAIVHVEITFFGRFAASLDADDIKKLQAALKPSQSASVADVLKDKEMMTAITDLNKDSKMIIAGAVGTLTKASGADPVVSATIQDMYSGHGDAMTVVGGSGAPGDAKAVVISSELLKAATMEQLMSIHTLVSKYDTARHFESYVCLRASRELDVGWQQVMMALHPLAVVGQGVKSKLEMAAIELPRQVMEKMEAADPFAKGHIQVAFLRPIIDEEVKHLVDGTTTLGAARAARALLGRNLPDCFAVVCRPELAIENIWHNHIKTGRDAIRNAPLSSRSLHPHEVALLGSFAYAVLVQQMVTGAGALPNVRAVGGVSMMECMKRGYYIDSTEVNRVANLDNIAPDMVVSFDTEIVRAVIAVMTEPELVDICHAARINSYLKSGHSGTAAGLINTIKRLSESMGCTRLSTDAVIEAEGPAGVYHMPHGASVRLMFAYYATLARAGDLSYAISRRLMVNAPGTTAYFLAFKYFNALERGRFWEFIGQQELYRAFRQAYLAWEPTARLEAPYANYMYGVSRAANEIFRAQSTTIMAYAFHIPMLMEGSSIASSVALRKVASQSASSDIVAGFHTSGYAAAYQAATRRSVTKNMRPKGAAALAIEEEGAF